MRDTDKAIEAAFSDQPQPGIIRSLPGRRALVAAEFIVAVGDLSTFVSPDHLAEYAGLAPVTRDSGIHSPAAASTSSGHRSATTATSNSNHQPLGMPEQLRHFAAPRPGQGGPVPTCWRPPAGIGRAGRPRWRNHQGHEGGGSDRRRGCSPSRLGRSAAAQRSFFPRPLMGTVHGSMTTRTRACFIPRVPKPLRHLPGVKGAARRHVDGLRPPLTPTRCRSSWHPSRGRGQCGGQAVPVRGQGSRRHPKPPPKSAWHVRRQPFSELLPVKDVLRALARGRLRQRAVKPSGEPVGQRQMLREQGMIGAARSARIPSPNPSLRVPTVDQRPYAAAPVNEPDEALGRQRARIKGSEDAVHIEDVFPVADPLASGDSKNADAGSEAGFRQSRGVSSA
ncbi:transposase [Micromonospora musae]|uniref:transposase n=1 Tax=Micromonospora musae TaxID=1894970 RepID=UPI003F4E23E2